MSGNSKLHDDINAKLYKLRGSGKDIIPALNPIFAAMDTGKTGALGASEFKTCLLALGIRTSIADITELFGLFDGLHLRSGGRVAYVGFVRSLVDALPGLPGYVAPKPKAFVSKLVAKEEAPPPRPVYQPAHVFSASALGASGQILSDDVGARVLLHDAQSNTTNL